MEKVTTLGIDLAKRVFALHGVNASRRVVLRKTVRCEQFVETVAKLAPSLIGMEACSGSHEWARRFQGLGHTVRLMAPVFVAPYRKSGKNDGNDAEAICEAVRRPNMRFVPVKSAEQQALLALHRVRQGFIEERTATINRLRAVLTEFGVVLPNRTQWVRRDALAAAEPLPVLARQGIEDHLVDRDDAMGLDKRGDIEAANRVKKGLGTEHGHADFRWFAEDSSAAGLFADLSNSTTQSPALPRHCLICPKQSSEFTTDLAFSPGFTGARTVNFKRFFSRQQKTATAARAALCARRCCPPLAEACSRRRPRATGSEAATAR